MPVLFLWPATMVLAYGSMYLMGAPLPDDPRFPILIVPLLSVVFLLSATFELDRIRHYSGWPSRPGKLHIDPLARHPYDLVAISSQEIVRIPDPPWTNMSVRGTIGPEGGCESWNGFARSREAPVRTAIFRSLIAR